MSTVTAIESAAGAASAAKASQSLGKDAFLTLLITQLQNQDPLNPADSTEFTAQLAQFSSLEQLSQINSQLETLGLFQASINNAQAVSFIGKEVLARGNRLEVSAGKPAVCEFALDAAAKTVIVSIYDSNGRFVRELQGSALAAGRQSIAWDGNDLSGNPVASGGYTFEVQAESASGDKIGATTWLRGAVSGVKFENGATYLRVGSSDVAVGDVIEIVNAAGAEG
jgi:flagellar basal-body rod modification protein FlgD